MLRPYKFHLVSICQEVDDATGQVVSEQTLSQAENQPLVVFGIAGLIDFANSFEAQLSALNMGIESPVPPNRATRRAARK